MTKAPSKFNMSDFERTKSCVFVRWVEANLSADEKEVLDEALRSPLSAYLIWEWLVERGATFTEQSVWRHRRGNRCGCRPRRESL